MKKYLSLEQVRAALPIKISRRTLSRIVTSNGMCYVHRRQIFIAESDVDGILEEAFKCRSPSSVKKVRISGSSARSAESASERARALLTAALQKPS